MAVVTNGDENAIPLVARTSVAPVESDEYEFSAKIEGSVVVGVSDVAATLEILPVVQGSFQAAVVTVGIAAGTTHMEVFLFRLGNYKIRVTPVSQPNNYGAAVRTVNYA